MNRKPLQFIKPAAMVLVGMMLLEATPAPARRVGTLEAPVPPSSNSADEAAVRALYQQKIDGWNKRSAADFAAAFTDDADLVTFGTHLEGRPEILAFHRQLFGTLFNGSRLEGRIKSVRFLSADVAVMHAVSSTLPPRQAEISQGRDSIETLVLTRTDGNWRIAALQDDRRALEIRTVLKPGGRLSRAQR